MLAHRKRIGFDTIERANEDHKARLAYYQEIIHKVEKDRDKKQRLEAQLCPMCHYQGRMLACQAVTERQCAFCETMIRSGNSNVDVLCPTCARTAQLCKRCGCDIDLKNRRKRELPEFVETIS